MLEIHAYSPGSNTRGTVTNDGGVGVSPYSPRTSDTNQPNFQSRRGLYRGHRLYEMQKRHQAAQGGSPFASMGDKY